MKKEETKACSTCGVIKPLDAFYRRRTNKDGRRSLCKECIRKQQAGYNGTDHGRAVAWDVRVRNKYGITRAKYEAMLRDQGGVCAICLQPERALSRTGRVIRLAIDHCHETGAVRGLLCSTCNTAIGKLRDQPIVVTRAVLYLLEHKERTA